LISKTAKDHAVVRKKKKSQVMKTICHVNRLASHLSLSTPSFFFSLYLFGHSDRSPPLLVQTVDAQHPLPFPFIVMFVCTSAWFLKSVIS
jgi:hypothetical protein